MKLLSLLLAIASISLAQGVGGVATGTGAPSSASCSTAANVGAVYLRTDAKAPNSSFYVCAQTANGVFAWELAQASGGGGGSTSVGGAVTGTTPATVIAGGANGLVKSINNGTGTGIGVTADMLSALGVTTGQAAGKVLGTCGTATAYAPCNLTPTDIPQLPTSQIIGFAAAVVAASPVQTVAGVAPTGGNVPINLTSAVVGTPSNHALRDRPTVADFGATGLFVALATSGSTAAGATTVVTGNSSLAATFAPLSNGSRQGVFIPTGGTTCTFVAFTHSGSTTLDGIGAPGTLFACNGTPLTDGAAISGTGIPGGATIANLTYGSNATSVTLSAASTATATIMATDGACMFTANTHSGTTVLDGIVSPCSLSSLSVGSSVTGTGIAGGATIATVTYGQPITTSLVMSAAATASAQITVTETLPDYVGTVSSVAGATLTVTPAIPNTVASGTLIQHDDTQAIMAARDACEAKFQLAAGLQSNFPLVRFPPGKYSVSSPFVFKSCSTRGDSIAPSTVNFYWNGSPNETIGAFYVPSTSYGYLGNGASKEITGFRLQPGNYQPINWLVSDSYIDQNFRLEAIHFIDATADAVYLKYGWANAHWHNLRFDGNAGAFHLVPLSTQYASSFLMEDFTFATSTTNANAANHFAWIDNSANAIYPGTIEFSNARIEIDTSPGWNASGQKTLFYFTGSSAYTMGFKMNGIDFQNNNALQGDSFLYNGTGNNYFSASISIDNSSFAGMNYFVSPLGSLFANGMGLPFQGGIRGITVVAGGTGYTNGDVISVVQSGAGGSALTVTASGGVVSAVTPTNRGYDYSVATPLATTGGTGTGLTVNISSVTIGNWDPLGINPINGLTWNSGGASLSDYGTRNITGSALGNPALTVQLVGDLFPRRIDLVGGGISWTNGTGPADTFFQRSGNNALSCGSTSGGTNCTLAVGNILGLSLRGTGSAPTIANGAAAGTTPGTPTVTGTNLSHKITVITGTSPTANATLATITNYGTLATAPSGCGLTPGNAAAASVQVYTTTPSTTTYTLATGAAALAASTTYIWNALCF